MTLQTAANITVALKRETTTGVAATATGAEQLRLIASPGLELQRARIESQEKRSDGNKSMGRLGGKSVGGSYNVELTVGGAQTMLLEAIMRSTWGTSTAVAMTSCAITTNAITQPSGDFVGTSGLRVGDIFTITGTSTAGNHNKRTPIIAIGSLTITVPTGTFVTATSTGTITRIRKLSSAATPTRYSHTIEQYDEDTDLSELFLGCRLTGARLSFRPGQMATIQYTFMGMDRTVLTTGTSPWFSSPNLTTGLSLVADDSLILKDGVAVTTYTGIDLEFTIGASTEAVIGSFVSPDVFDNDLTVTGTITGLRSDFTNLTAFDAETEFAISGVLLELTADPKPCIGFFLPRVKIAALSAPVGGDDGAKIETLGLMIAPKVAATGYDGTIANWFSSIA